MAIDRKELAKALRVLADTPAKIAEQDGILKAKLAEIKKKEMSGDWSPNTIAAEKKAAVETHDRICHSLVSSMKPAYQTVRENNNLTKEPLDFNSPEIQNVVRVLPFLDKHDFASQTSLLEGFRGNIAGLRFLKGAFEKAGFSYMAKKADEMMRPISEQALEEMGSVLSSHDYHERVHGTFSFPAEKMYWTHGEFQRQIDRMGLDDSDAVNPLYNALDDAAEAYGSATDNPAWKQTFRLIADLAKQKINDGADPTSVMNNTIRHFEEKAAVLAAEQAQAE